MSYGGGGHNCGEHFIVLFHVSEHIDHFKAIHVYFEFGSLLSTYDHLIAKMYL